MPLIETTSLSTKGQVVIPKKVRGNLNLSAGSKLIVIQKGDSILLKPISISKTEQFERLISLGNKIRDTLNLTEKDVEKAI